MPYRRFPPPVNYCRAIVIVHGKSELLMMEYLKRKFRLNIVIISNCNGRSSIQVNGLLKFMLSNTKLKSLNAVKKEFIPQTENNKLIDCPIFTIMDLDDCNEREAALYKSGEMFKGKWFEDYVIPIWFSPHFDEAMKNAKFVDKLPSDKEKGKVYADLFQKELTGLKDLDEFKKKMEKCKNTNIEELVEYCAYVVKKYEK